jgi:hypothetical protein
MRLPLEASHAPAIQFCASDHGPLIHASAFRLRGLARSSARPPPPRLASPHLRHDPSLPPLLPPSSLLPPPSSERITPHAKSPTTSTSSPPRAGIAPNRHQINTSAPTGLPPPRLALELLCLLPSARIDAVRLQGRRCRPPPNHHDRVVTVVS